jgi:inward rectifier potassium channel
VVHRITPDSPLHGATHESLKEQEAELTCSVVGIDGTSAQTVHARHVYDGERDLRFGMRHADMLTSLPDGTVQLDYSKFDQLIGARLD